MRLFDGHNFQNLHNFFLLIHPVESSPRPADMQPVQDISIFKREFFFVSPVPRIGTVTKGDEFYMDDPPALFIKRVDLINLSLLDDELKR